MLVALKVTVVQRVRHCQAVSKLHRRVLQLNLPLCKATFYNIYGTHRTFNKPYHQIFCLYVSSCVACGLQCTSWLEKKTTILALYSTQPGYTLILIGVACCCCMFMQSCCVALAPALLQLSLTLYQEHEAPDEASCLQTMRSDVGTACQAFTSPHDK